MCRYLTHSVLVIALAVPALAQTAQDPGRQPAALRVTPAEVTYAHFDASVFKVELPMSQAVGLDPHALAEQASSPAALVQNLQALGKVSLAYRLHQSVALGARRPTTVSAGVDAPYVSGTITNTSGSISTSARRTTLGGKLEVQASGATSSGVVHVALTIEMSALTDSTVSIQKDVSAPVFASVVQSFAGTMQDGQPLIMLSVEGGNGDSLVAYVTWIGMRGPS